MSIAIVTGASSGIGQKLTELLTQYFKVDEVWAVARREDRLKQLSAGSVPVRAVALDLANTQSFEELGRQQGVCAKLLPCAVLGAAQPQHYRYSPLPRLGRHRLF